MKHPLVWAEIDLAAIAHNIQALRAVVRPNARLMAVVKANAYGHGAVAVARQALASGADYLGVARIDEAIELRTAGLNAPILVFGYTSASRAEDLIDHDLTPTVYDVENARQLARTAAKRGARLGVHVKIDTGMGRLGIVAQDQPSGPGSLSEPDPALQAVTALARLGGIELRGIYTHFAASDSADKAYTLLQLERFNRLLTRLRQNGLEIPLRHAANSGGIIDLPETHLDLVRAGIALYGLYPSQEVERRKVALKPAMTLKTRIVHLKKVPAGFNVSYGMTHQTQQPTTIATVPIGYADGYNRRLSSRGFMLIGGQRVPVVGRVCMDMTMLDVGGLSDVGLEDEVVVFGRQAAAELPADELAVELGTINYEIVAAILPRVARLYHQASS